MRNKTGAVEHLVVALWYGFTAINIGISQLPSVKESFQEKRAIEICEYSGESGCEAKVQAMSKEQILASIKDDSIDGTGFYAPKQIAKSGGGLRARILQAQK